MRTKQVSWFHIRGKQLKGIIALAWLLICVVLSLVLTTPSFAQTPQSLDQRIEISPATPEVNAIRMAFNHATNRMMLLSIGGDISSFDISDPQGSIVPHYSVADHGAPPPTQGFAVANDGTIYVVGNDPRTYPGFNVGVVKRGVPNGNGGHSWETVFTTVPYARSGTNYDHNMNAIVMSPDGTSLYVNSGSRTDHGEVQDNNGQFPGLREVPLTSAILRIPANTTDLVLENDIQFLSQNGYLFADGVRNSFSMAFDKDGTLYATDNSGDRDDSEELNLLAEGSHQGFPWKMGLSDNPMQFAGYQAGSDLLLNPQAGAVQGGYFYNDPNFPSVPDGVNFSDPATNLGPDADLVRDPMTGEIVDASDQEMMMGTFTSHRSPLGLVFDTTEYLPGGFHGDAFVLSWTGQESPLLGPFVGEGEDLIHLEFVQGSGGKSLEARRIASNFINPIDAVLLNDQLFVLEYGTGARVWKIWFVPGVAVEEVPTTPLVQVDLYPNPTTRALHVQIEQVTPERLTIEMVNLTGNVVDVFFEGFHAGGRFDLTHAVSQHVPAGVYLIVISGKRVGRHVRKIVML